MLKFSLTHNTPTDIVKAVTATLVAGGTAYTTVAPNGVTAGEWIVIIVATLTALGTVLGLYSDAKKEEPVVEEKLG